MATAVVLPGTFHFAQPRAVDEDEDDSFIEARHRTSSERKLVSSDDRRLERDGAAASTSPSPEDEATAAVA